ncbi:2,3-bisphosphoglycerate-dependent phosphoglycerate mutase [Blastococcus sp. DSM 46786]|uniref:2,3-bisphosphoglycerate-dependent phosphoglycerate mutase n=1 Tax=Blastococcus sp. DSM 46786 TaxID=1798227 RepID=UPI0008C3A30D|nr:2,3-bisphosphoglycerate-dependent phosphoglycerate mutase [Blastococcus sp. DSM 46786]SEK92564.1 2,3-bisphosphoglycerate-dependent phosphoglycerate mutase [Blastococcus sp. DSM 46786]
MPSLVLLRHGESAWNAEDRFTGRVDVDLTPRGEDQARRCGVLLREAGLVPDRSHTSTLTRAVRTGALALAAAGRPLVPARQDERLDERGYGALEGLTRGEVRDRHGSAQYQRWRRSWDAAPPPAFRGGVRRTGESLADVAARLRPCWEDALAPDLRAGHTVLVTAHSNSLRALIALLDQLGPEEVLDLEVPIATPLHYALDGHLRPLVPGGRYVRHDPLPRGSGPAIHP